jgi:anti-sigma B factor antagonist
LEICSLLSQGDALGGRRGLSGDWVAWAGPKGQSSIINGKRMASNEPAITVGYGTDVTIATFNEPTILNEQQIRDLEAELLTVIANNGEKRLILDFENVQFMSSAFLGLLVKVHKRVIEAGGTLQLYNLNPKIHKIFEITKLTRIFDIVRTK